MIKKIKLLLSIFLITILFFELISFVLTKNNLFIVNDTPSLYKEKTEFLDDGTYRNEKENWGAWRAKNASVRASSSCYDYVDSSNEIGARDSSFKNVLTNSWILLGDSFAEGFGVSNNVRSQAYIEKIINKKILNFSTAMHFGPVQYWTIYNELAKKYPHEGVLIFLLPMNDFTDNDYSYWKDNDITYIANGAERYRPYYKKISDGDYVSFIPPDATKRDSLLYGVRSPFMQWMTKYFWASNAFRTFQIISLKNSLEKLPSNTSTNDSSSSKPYSGYFDATLDQQKATVFYLEKIIKDANLKKITIVAIPTIEDFSRFQKGERREKMLWWETLNELEAKYSGRVKFIDLIDNPPNGDLKNLSLPCDGHWGLEGNRWAGENIGQKMRKFN